MVCASEDSQVFFWKYEDHRKVVNGKRIKVSTTSHENFPCKDVSVAITWPGKVKGDPPPMPTTSKKLAKRVAQSPSTAIDSPTREEVKKHLPPLPKKNNKMERASTAPEEVLALVSRESGIAESVDSNSSSVQSDDSSSISAATEPNPSSTTQDDPSSLAASASSNSSSTKQGDSDSQSNQTIQVTAWGLVIVTATVGGEIRTYQNFGLPCRLNRLSQIPYLSKDGSINY